MVDSLPDTPGATATEDYVDRLLFSLTSLSEIGSLLTSEGSFRKVAEAGLRSTMGSVAATSGALLVFEPSEQKLRLLAFRGLADPTEVVDVDLNLQQYLVDAKAPIPLEEATLQQPVFRQASTAIQSYQAVLWIPLVVNEDLLGVLSLGEGFQREAYGDDDLKLLKVLGHHFSVGLLNQRLMADAQGSNFKLNRKVVELETLYDAVLTLSSSLDVEDVIEEVLLLTVGILDARGGCLILKDERTGRFALAHQVGLREDQCAALETSQVRRKMGRMMRASNPAFLDPAEMHLKDLEHVLVAPVGKVGLLAVADKETRQGVQPFTESDAHLLQLMAQQAGAALTNARLYKNILEVKNYNQDILSSIGSGVISTDLKGRMVQVNPSVSRIFGDEESLLGKSCARFFSRCGCQRLAEAVAESLKDGEDRQIDGETVEERGINLNGRITALRNDRDEIQGVVVALEDLTQEMRMQRMFKQYASDQVVDLLLSEGRAPSLGGESRDVTILFVDVRASTALLGRIGAEAMGVLLNDCFSRLNEIVFQFNGTLDKYTGDGFMVTFGAPLSFEDDTERAVRTALAMREEMIRFNKGRGEPMPLAFGISRGEVLAGNIGSIRRMEYTVIGDAVVLASRLCDGARAGQIWVGENVYEEVKDVFQLEPLGPQRFKGVASVNVYELVGTGQASGGDAQTRKKSRTETEKKSLHEKVDLILPMVPQMELTATSTVASLAEFMGMDSVKVEEIKTAVIEACINAFEHSQSKERRVYLALDVTEEALEIQVIDKGQGFNQEEAEKKVAEKRARGEKKRGWGMTIIHEMMDEVDVQSDGNGTVLTMVKRL